MKTFLFVLVLFLSIVAHGQEKEPTNQDLKQQIEDLNHKLNTSNSEIKLLNYKIEEAKLNNKEDVEYYLNYISDTLMTTGLLITLVVGIVGIAIPLYMQRQRESQTKNTLAKIDDDIKNLQAYEARIEAIKTEVDNLKTDTKKASEEAQEAAKKAKISELYSEVLKSREDLDKQIELLDEIITLNPSDGLGYYNRGAVYRAKEMHDEAIKDFNTAIGIEPKNFWWHLDVAYLYLGEALYDEAIRIYNIAISIDPTSPIPYSRKETIYIALMKKEADADMQTKYMKLAEKERREYHRLLRVKEKDHNT